MQARTRKQLNQSYASEFVATKKMLSIESDKLSLIYKQINNFILKISFLQDHGTSISFSKDIMSIRITLEFN